MSTEIHSKAAVQEPRIDFRTSPEEYKHWNLTFDGRVARLALDVEEDATLVPGYELKLNSYDLGVDIELYDALQRIRFEHPEVGAVVITSDKERVFCAGANIRMLSQSTHSHKVNFCKFTNETRNGIEDANNYSGVRFLAAVNGACAGGGYELALACDHIMLIDDGSSTVSLPELPLLAVLPGTGGLTRLVDKRKVRHDRADYFCTTSEGVRGKRAIDWGFVDEIIPRSKFDDTVTERAKEFALESDRPVDAIGIKLTPLTKKIEETRISYETLTVEIDRDLATATLTIIAPTQTPPEDVTGIENQGAAFWPLNMCRDLEDAIMELRVNEKEIGTWIFKTEGVAAHVEAADKLLIAHADHWLVREIILFLKRTFKKIDVSSRSVITLVEPGSCFTGTLLELVLAADRSYMLDGTFEGSNVPAAEITLTELNFGPLEMPNGLSRLAHRFLNDPSDIETLKAEVGQTLDALKAEDLGLVTFAPDDIDWDDEVRIAVEERTSFSPDALTGMEASLRFAGPETMETKIFGRLSAWQNWIFQRPNAVGEDGALKVFGSGQRAEYDKKRV